MVVVVFVETAAGQEEPEEKGKESYASSTSFSLLLTSGNTQELTFGFDTEQSLVVKRNQFQLKGSVIYGRSDGTKNAEFYYSHLKFKRELTSRLFFLSFNRFERNTLAGYNHRLSLSAGAGYQWVKKTAFEGISEVTLGWSHENQLDLDSTSLSFMSLFVSSSAKIGLSSNSHILVMELFSLNLSDARDFRSDSFISVTADISKFFSFKISYQLFYNHKGIPGYKNMDHYILSSLVFNLGSGPQK